MVVLWGICSVVLIVTNGSTIAKLDALLTVDGSLPAAKTHDLSVPAEDDAADPQAEQEGSFARAVRAARKAVSEDPYYYAAETYSAFPEEPPQTGWSTPSGLAADDEGVSDMRQALRHSAARIAVAQVGIRQALEVMAMFEARLTSAREPDADHAALNAELVRLRQQMREIADNAAFEGENWLVTRDGNATPDAPIAAGLQRGADGTVQPQTIDYGRDGNGAARPYRLIDELSPGTHGILTQPGAVGRWDTGIPNYVFMTGRDRWQLAREMAVDATTTSADFARMISGTEYLRRQLSAAATHLGTLAARIEFHTGVLDALHDGSHRSDAAARDTAATQQAKQDKALKVRAELEISPFPIANSHAAAVAALFR